MGMLISMPAAIANRWSPEMPTIVITEEYDPKLRLLLTDFGQSRESIVQDLIDAELARRGISLNGARRDDTPEDDLVRLDPDGHGTLVHTKVISAVVDGREIHRAKWNGIRHHIHILAMKRLGSLRELQEVSDARLRPGRYEQEGFRYLPEGDFSIPGVDANLCWDQSLGIARAIRVPIKVTLEWREKEGAAHPGRRGVLEWAPGDV